MSNMIILIFWWFSLDLSPWQCDKEKNQLRAVVSYKFFTVEDLIGKVNIAQLYPPFCPKLWNNAGSRGARTRGLWRLVETGLQS